MSKLEEFKKHIKPGKAYRRADLAQWSTSVDRHIVQLLKEGVLTKAAPGLYFVPQKTAFGAAPPDEEILVRTFLKDDDFLLTSPNSYNGLGVGTTQLYNKRVVYNHKRHGEIKLGGRTFHFQSKPKFPRKATEEFLLVDLVNNLEQLAEDKEAVLKKVFAKAQTMDTRKLGRSVSTYGSAKTKGLFSPSLKQAAASKHVS